MRFREMFRDPGGRAGGRTSSQPDVFSLATYRRLIADLDSRSGLSRGPDGLVVGFRRFGIARWKARHSTFPTGFLRAKTDEVSSSTFRALSHILVSGA